GRSPVTRKTRARSPKQACGLKTPIGASPPAEEGLGPRASGPRPDPMSRGNAAAGPRCPAIPTRSGSAGRGSRPGSGGTAGGAGGGGGGWGGGRGGGGAGPAGNGGGAGGQLLRGAIPDSPLGTGSSHPGARPTPPKREEIEAERLAHPPHLAIAALAD